MFTQSLSSPLAGAMLHCSLGMQQPSFLLQKSIRSIDLWGIMVIYLSHGTNTTYYQFQKAIWWLIHAICIYFATIVKSCSYIIIWFPSSEKQLPPGLLLFVVNSRSTRLWGKLQLKNERTAQHGGDVSTDGCGDSECLTRTPSPRAHVRWEMHRWTTNQG